MKISEALAELGRPVVYYPSLTRIVDDLHAVILLCYLFFWKGKDEKVRRTSEEIEEETGLTYKMQIRAREILENLGFVLSEYDRHSHEIIFTIFPEKIDNAWEAARQASDKKEDAQGASYQKSDGILPKVRCHSGALNEIDIENIHTTSADSARGSAAAVSTETSKPPLPLSVNGKLTQWGVLGVGSSEVHVSHSEGWPEDVRGYAQAWEADFLGRPATKAERGVIIKQIRELIARGYSLDEFKRAIRLGLSDMRERGVRIARPLSVAYAIEAMRKAEIKANEEESLEDIAKRWYGG